MIGGSRKGTQGGIGATARRRGHSVYGAAHANRDTDSDSGGSGGRGGKYDQDPQAWAGRRHGANMRLTGRGHTAAHPKGRNPGDVWTGRRRGDDFAAALPSRWFGHP